MAFPRERFYCKYQNYHEFQNHTFKIITTSPRDQWVKIAKNISFHKISQSLEETRLGVEVIILLWDFTGASTAMLLRSLANFSVKRELWPHVSCLQTVKPLQDLVPIRLTLFRLNSKFHQTLECFSLKYAQRITTNFFTCHDSVTVVKCAKFCCDR